MRDSFQKIRTQGDVVDAACPNWNRSVASCVVHKSVAACVVHRNVAACVVHRSVTPVLSTGVWPRVLSSESNGWVSQDAAPQVCPFYRSWLGHCGKEDLPTPPLIEPRSSSQ
jgi:hypothetical protein